MFAASCSRAMVQSVSISNVSPCVRSSTTPEATLPTSADDVAASRCAPPADPSPERWLLAEEKQSRRSHCFPSKEALRPPQQQQNREHVNEDGPALRQIEFEHKVEHAKKQRCIVDADDTAESADRNGNQEIDQIFERILRIEPEKLGAESAAEASHAAAKSEGDREQPIDIDAKRLRHSAVVDRGADLRANAGTFEREPDTGNDEKSDHDQENTVGTILREAKVDLATQFGRQLHRLTLWTDDDGKRGHENKN